MPRPKTPSLIPPEPGILTKSGLDVTLENIEKRLTDIDRKLDDAPTIAHVEALEGKITELQSDYRQEIKEVRETLEKQIAEKADKHKFELVQKVVFGFVSIVLTGVAGALIALVLK